jgi:hypothetical protein
MSGQADKPDTDFRTTGCTGWHSICPVWERKLVMAMSTRAEENKKGCIESWPSPLRDEFG